MSESNASVCDAVYALLQQGKAENYDAIVQDSAQQLAALRRMVQRIQSVAPDVALSPYVMRALLILDGQTIAQDDGSISAAA